METAISTSLQGRGGGRNDIIISYAFQIRQEGVVFTTTHMHTRLHPFASEATGPRVTQNKYDTIVTLYNHTIRRRGIGE
jgi:hypothetical protein